MCEGSTSGLGPSGLGRGAESAEGLAWRMMGFFRTLPDHSQATLSYLGRHNIQLEALRNAKR